MTEKEPQGRETSASRLVMRLGPGLGVGALAALAVVFVLDAFEVRMQELIAGLDMGIVIAVAVGIAVAFGVTERNKSQD